MAPDRDLDEYAAHQYGVFALRQARAVGFTESMVHHRLRSGAWIRLAPSVYALASAPPRWERRVAAAVLSRPRTLVVGRTAAHLLGFDGIRPGAVEIAVPAGSNARSPAGRVVRTKWFEVMARTWARGFEVTTDAETLLTLAPRMPVDELERHLDDRLASRSLSLSDFDPIRRRIAGGRVRGSRRLFELVDARSETAWQPPTTALERLLDRLVDHPSVPPVVRQHPFAFDELPMIVDLYIPAWRLVLEADGRRWHTRRADFERDRARDNAAAAHGLVVVRFTWTMLTEDFEGCRRTLLATGRSRSRSA